ncbi:MAG: hypothetical protein ABSD88_18695 [Candidatus Korobacteraceae bacterium]|jgi:hypothetical protein
MAGMLHIFRRRIANGGEIYQVNFTLTGGTFAKVFATPEELDEFLVTGIALDPSDVDAVWQDINRAGNTVLDEVSISPQQAAALGMSHADVDF